MSKSNSSLCIAEGFDIDYYEKSFALDSIKTNEEFKNVLIEFLELFMDRRETFQMDVNFQDEDSEEIVVDYQDLGDLVSASKIGHIQFISYYISRDSLFEFNYEKKYPIVVHHKNLGENKVIDEIRQNGKVIEVEHQGCADSVDYYFGYRLIDSQGQVIEAGVDRNFNISDAEDIDEETINEIEQLSESWHQEIFNVHLK